MSRFVEDKTLRDKVRVVRNREKAGRRLGKNLELHLGSYGLILAVASGGVPVTMELARIISVPLDLQVLNKIPEVNNG